MKKRKIVLNCAVLLLGNPVFSQLGAPNLHYELAYSELVSMLRKSSPLDFQHAVFTVENAYYENKLNENLFNEYITAYALLSQSIAQSGQIQYKEFDNEEGVMQCAVFLFMSDSIPFDMGERIAIHSPFLYNNQDFDGRCNWDDTFVSKLMQTEKGNCYSLSFLYRMIMNKLGYKAYLSLVPNHVYIKIYNDYVGWYNIELTCADFPIDAWFMSSGYVSTNAVQNRIYMDTLSDQQSIALCMLNLAIGYQIKFGQDDDSFPLRCCQTALQYFPHSVRALSLQSEILSYRYQKADKNTLESTRLLTQINELAITLYQLGHRPIPDFIYQKWLQSLDEQTSNKTMRSIIYHN